MRIKPISSTPNISNVNSHSPCMSIGTNGFPHISWIEDANGQDKILYKFWDGLQWSFHDSPIVSRSDQNIITSNYSMVLRNNVPFIVFSTRNSDNENILKIATIENGQWNIVEHELNYQVSWIGSTSITTNQSSSSESTDGYNIIIVVLDTQDNLNIYKYIDENLVFSGTINEAIENMESIQIDSYENQIGISYLYSNEYIQFNSYDTILENFEFPVFAIFDPSDINEDIIDYSLSMSTYGLSTVVSMAWLSTDLSGSYVRHSMYEIDGTYVNIGATSDIYSTTNLLVVSNNYSMNPFNRIAIDHSDKVRIVATGSRNIFFEETISAWNNEILCFDNEFIEEIGIDYVDNLKIVFSSNGHIKYYEDNGDDSSEIVYPSITVLTDEKPIIGTWIRNSFFSSNEVDGCIYDVGVADILRESILKAIVAASEEDPLCQTSSSSSTSSFSTSSESSSSESSFSSSSDSSSSSSFGYSSSSQSSESSSSYSSSSSESSSSESSSSESSSSSSLSSFSSLSSESEGNTSSSSSLSSSGCAPCSTPCDLNILFKTYTVPDRIKVYDNTGLMLDTGFISTGNVFNEYNLSELECPVRICVNAPTSGTAWHLIANGCGLCIDEQGGQVVEICWDSDPYSSSSSSSGDVTAPCSCPLGLEASYSVDVSVDVYDDSQDCSTVPAGTMVDTVIATATANPCEWYGEGTYSSVLLKLRTDISPCQWEMTVTNLYYPIYFGSEYADKFVGNDPTGTYETRGCSAWPFFPPGIGNSVHMTSAVVSAIP